MGGDVCAEARDGKACFSLEFEKHVMDSKINELCLFSTHAQKHVMVSASCSGST